MTRGRDSLFPAVRTEGAMLPPDALARVANLDRDLGGLTSEDYHLGAGERINEAASRAWARARSLWTGSDAARQDLRDGESGTGLTRERWLLPLFQELGYGRLARAKSIEVEGRDYPVSHAWQGTPIHLIGWGVDLDRRTPGEAGAARASPHSIVQELLNRSDEHLWAFVSNGRRLRVLRDNVSLTRQAYVEFDLEAIMDGELFADFRLLWLICHESRVESEVPEACWLERWSRAAREQGARALERLRGGVETAIEALGRGFLSHPANVALQNRLHVGELSAQDYYRQLLRLVYRLIFLFVAEDRDLLLEPSAGDLTRDNYFRYYSTQRLRRLANRRRGDRHADLYQALCLVMDKLDSSGCPEFGLPALGSFLFSPDAVAGIEGARLANRDLLEAVRGLAFVHESRGLRPVDYRNLGAEELGSVYESLLELHPEIHKEAGDFRLATAGGHERKTTGSYYTPTILIERLLDLSLDPLLDEATHKQDPEAAILALKVCDPATGSGHFLVAAAHRIARRLATVRAGEDEPPPDQVRHALRDVIGHCIYGVDMNPMAVELCKVSLWLESMEPGRPLSFLDHRILCGNSVVGATPAALADGIPDDAFKAIEGDDKEVVSALRRRNALERKRKQADLFPFAVAEATVEYSSLGDRVTALENMREDSAAAVREKAAVYERLQSSSEYRRSRLVADAWCATFLWSKAKLGPPCLTEQTFRTIQQNPDEMPGAVRREVQRLAAHHRLFHWHLGFPDVFPIPTDGAAPENSAAGWSGGFDLVFGNPPWDTLSPDKKEFFSAYEPDVRSQDRDGQNRLVDALLEDESIAASWRQYRRDLYADVHFFKNSGRYQLFAPGNLGKGDFNVYRMFVETALSTARAGGFAAQVVPENFYNGANAMAIRQMILEEFELRELVGFENTNQAWFRGVHTAAKFAIYAARRGSSTKAFRASFNIRSTEELAVHSSEGTLTIPVPLVREFSPDALAIMEFGSQLDIDIAQKMYALWPKFGDRSAGPPYREYMREIDMGNDRELFGEDPDGLPVYEGYMVAQYDHRAKAYRSGRGRSAVWQAMPFGASDKAIVPQWHITRDSLPPKLGKRPYRFRAAFCDIASPTNERSLLGALLPAECVAGHTVPTIEFPPEYHWAYLPWLAVANSFVMDFLVRFKVSLHMTYTIMDSLPFPRLPVTDDRVARLAPLVLKLTCTGPEMTDFWNLMAEHGWVESVPREPPPPGAIQDAERLRIRAEIEAIVARQLFDLNRDELEYVLDSFPTARKYDIKKYGDFRTKLAVLKAYDELHVESSPERSHRVSDPGRAHRSAS